ncbi:MAG TPA: trigger factor [Candidatus Dormibacteraeota bacterium]|nr:trigger factor [Candidatus Dormibacteraeota bacterium]
MPSPISVQTEQLPKSQVGMTIEVPADMVDATYEKVLNRLASRAKLEGFRPGRAPRALVEARVGAAALREEVVEAIVPEVMRQALAGESINPIDNPDVEVLELERGRPARLKATVSVMPQVTLGDAKALSVPAPSVEVTDEMIERRLADVREPMAEITPVDREVRAGDVAVVDVEVEADGEVVPSQSEQAKEIELKEGALLPELLEAIPGAKVGETRAVTVTFPEDYGDPKLAGKEGTIKVTVQGVKEKVLPALDDALAKQLSGGEQETVDSYRTAVRAQLEEAAKNVAQMAREQALVKGLVESSCVEVPETLVERELASHLDSLQRSLNRQGLRLDRYLEYLGKSPEQWIAEERPEAEARLKVDLVLDEFAKSEKIEPTEDEVTAYIEEQAARDDELKGSLDELRRGPNSRRFFASRLRRLRVLERLGEVGGAAMAAQT